LREIKYAEGFSNLLRVQSKDSETTMSALVRYDALTIICKHVLNYRVLGEIAAGGAQSL